MARHRENPTYWEVPYLPIDPADVGRSYDPIIRINSQSGKGGVSYVLEENFGLRLPRNLQKDFGAIVTKVSDSRSAELVPKDLYDLFMETYVITDPLALLYYDELTQEEVEENDVLLRCRMSENGRVILADGHGNGSISAFCHILEERYGLHIEVTSYSEHSIGLGTRTKAITYIEAHDADGNVHFGAGISTNITKSSLRAVMSVANQMLSKK